MVNQGTCLAPSICGDQDVPARRFTKLEAAIFNKAVNFRGCVMGEESGALRPDPSHEKGTTVIQAQNERHWPSDGLPTTLSRARLRLSPQSSTAPVQYHARK